MGPYKDFKGDIKLDVRDSKADWGPFAPKKAPEGAPNVLFVLYYLAVIASLSGACSIVSFIPGFAGTKLEAFSFYSLKIF